jgi:esterase/lipase superfamily enzyme
MRSGQALPPPRQRRHSPILVTFHRHVSLQLLISPQHLAAIPPSGASVIHMPRRVSFVSRPSGSAPRRFFGRLAPHASRFLQILLGLTLPALLAGCVSMGVPDVSGSVGDMFASQPPDVPNRVAIFVASVRNGENGAANEMSHDGTHYSLQMISVPPHHKIGEIERPSFGAPDPNQHFLVASRRDLDDEDAFRNGLATHISGRIGSNRDVLLYVHGFNTSYDEARFRLAQIVQDGRFGGVPVLFTWPSSDNLLGYEAARETAAASRDALANVLRDLAQLPDVGRVHILAHSLGTWLTMEALRERAIAGSPDLGGKLGNVMLAAPDIDLSVFREQLGHLDASHISVLVSSKDKALSLSSWLAGDRPRVGALNPHRRADRIALDKLGVKVYDLSGESTGFVGHGMYADAPEVVRAIGMQIGKSRLQDSDVQAVLGKQPIDPTITAAPLPSGAPAPAGAPVGTVPANGGMPSAVPPSAAAAPAAPAPAAAGAPANPVPAVPAPAQ